MALELGTSNETAEKLLNVGSGIVKNCKNIGTYTYRILSSFYMVHELYYPTFRKDNDTGEPKASWNVLRVPHNQPHLLSPVVAFDKKLKAVMGKVEGLDENTRSTIEPTPAYLCLIFDRKEVTARISVASLKRSIMQQILEHERKVSPKDTSKVWHGPAFLWDAYIEHKKDERVKGPEWTKHSYEVEVITDTNKFENQIPVSIIGAKNPQEYLIELGKKVNPPINVIEMAFTQEEIKLMDSYEGDIKKLSTPMSNDEIAEELNKFPINPNGKDKYGNHVFASPKELYEKLKTLELPARTDESVGKLTSGEVETPPSENLFGDSVELEPSKEIKDAVSEEADKTDRPMFTDV